MTTQKQIREWIPSAGAIFRKYMPDMGEIPEIHIVSERTLFQTRKELVERLQSAQKNTDEENYTSVMEMIHGEKGDAILIRQRCIPSPEKDNMVE